MICSPSFLSCDFTKLESEIKSIDHAKWLHFDVMDGIFVENTTYDEEMVKDIKSISSQFFDVHLMIIEPKKHVDKYINAGADLITFHLEATEEPLELIKKIKKSNVKAGISIKPQTPVESLDFLLPYLDLILIMSVEPGKGGQKFIEDSLTKINYLFRKKQLNNYKFLIEVDGGINLETAKRVRELGCDVIVVGSFLFNSSNRNQLIEELENV
ncbi:MAG: ribulose-phosphate 3-epimerase [Candidatus Izemoplasmatales bacterium]|nr:ribulose-phosphate 3-epimerase [Candidatus Izemoplasmatales bacterium]